MPLGQAGQTYDGTVDPYQQFSRNSNAARTLIDSFQREFSRAPTNDELNQLLPSFLGGDANIVDVAGGNASLSAYKQQQDQTPQKIFERQQKETQDAYTGKQGTIDPQVANIFQQNLGRAPTADEAQHFGMLIASGQDPYQVQQALQQTTEYQTHQTQQFTDQLGKQLQGTNADYFSKYILPAIQSQNAQAGRSQDSSGYQSQLANAAQQQNYGLQNYLAGVSANNYGQSTQNAAANYSGLLNQQYGLQNAGVSNQLANNAANTQYNQNLNMYQMQQQAYNNYLNNYGKRSGAQGIGGAVGGVLGGAVGAYFGGPTGATAGYQMGSGAGSAAGAFF